jgi:integrase
LNNFQAKIIKPAISRATDAAAQAGISMPTNFRRAYDMRHSSISMLIADGANILEIAERHGHDPAVTLGDYGHLKDEAEVELTNRLDARHQQAMAIQTGAVVPFTRRCRRASSGD